MKGAPVEVPMSENDLIHLDSHFKNWMESRGENLSEQAEPWNFYCLEQFMRPFDLADEELLSGITDGGLDGGIDAFYFLVDRELVREDTDLDPKTAKTVDLVLFVLKNRDEGFKPTEIDKGVFFIDDLLDLSRDTDSMGVKYKPELLSLMSLFHEKYPAISSAFPVVTISFYYITRADGSAPNDSAARSSKLVQARVGAHLPKAKFSYNFVNAQKLLDQLQIQRPSTRVLRWAESPAQTDGGQVGVVALRDYYSFITDDAGVLDLPIFESNIRGWQGSTQVNEQIRESLESSSPINFWLLNNGITILTPEVGQAGSKRLNLRNPRVVNGLQTSRAIYEYFRGVGKSAEDVRTILVRVIETADSAVFDAVVRATNSQNKMPASSLRATDPIHGQIEELFKRFDLYYDRRKGVHRDAGRQVSKIIAVTEVLQAVVAIMLQRPDDARARPGAYLSKDEKYKQVFGADSHSLVIYVRCTKLMRRVDSYMARKPELTKGDRRNIRYYVAAMLACNETGAIPPDPTKVAAIETDRISEDALERAFITVWLKFQKLGPTDKIAKGPELLKKLTTDLKRKQSRAKSLPKSRSNQGRRGDVT
jgi:hypothetical protein